MPKENIYSAQELYEQLKTQVALESSNSYINHEILKLLINDIGDITLFDLLYDWLPTDQIRLSDSRCSIYLELQDKNCRSLRAIIKRLEKIAILMSKNDLNLESKESRLTKLLGLAQSGCTIAFKAFQNYGIFLSNTEGIPINFDDLILQIKQKEKYQKIDTIIDHLLKVYESIVNEQIKANL